MSFFIIIHILLVKIFKYKNILKTQIFKKLNLIDNPIQSSRKCKEEKNKQ